MPGALLQLAAYGPQDIYLTGNPQITFFVKVYKRHTNFAIESVQQLFIGEASFGKKVYCLLDRIGDLVGEIFLDIQISKFIDLICFDNASIIDPTWVNGIGQALIKYYEIEIGGTLIDRQYGAWLDIWSEFTISCCKKEAYDSMIAKDEYNNPMFNNRDLYLYVPLQFWFCRNKGLALPLIALQYHQLKISFQFRKLKELIHYYDPTIDKSIVEEHIKTKCVNVKFNKACLYIDYYFLDDVERRLFAQNKHKYLIDQIQINTFTFNPQNENNSDYRVNLDLHFNHPVKELIWTTQKNTNISNNIYFNYSASEDPTSVRFNTMPTSDLDALIKAKLQFEGKDRMDFRDNLFFRLYQPYQRHTSVPNNFIYVYSFALEPESHQPSGTCNFSRIDHANLIMHLRTRPKNNTTESESELTINIYAVNYNILKIMNGMAGVKYAD